jgi:hypothetical protein
MVFNIVASPGNVSARTLSRNASPRDVELCFRAIGYRSRRAEGTKHSKKAGGSAAFLLFRLEFDLSQIRIGDPCVAVAVPLVAPGQQRLHRVVSTNERTSAISNVMENAMSNAGQALLMTTGIFGLSFLTILAIWYADRLRVGTPRKL